MDISKKYAARGVSAGKEDVHKAIRNLDRGLFPKAFCKIVPDLLAGNEEMCTVMHADGAGTKSALAYAYWMATGDLNVWKNIAHDAVVMNTDDLLCVGATGPILISSTIGRNKREIPGEVIRAIIEGTEECLQLLREHGMEIHSTGGETADVGDLVRSVIVDSTVTTRLKRSDVISTDAIQPGDVIVGLASDGQSKYETQWNSGIGSNGLTSARHDLFNKKVKELVPESFDRNMEVDLSYCGPYFLTDHIEGCPLNAGKMVLSPTRTYAPIIVKMLGELPDKPHAIIHCSGGAQTKILHFIDKFKVVKNSMMPIPLIFRLIQQHSGTEWSEMYQVFNMGHRMELYLPEKFAETAIAVAEHFGVKAAIIGYVADSAMPVVEIQHGDQILTYAKS